MTRQEFDVVIIGGSAAGLSAALMVSRALRSVLVIDEGSPRNRFTDHMHGVLGHDGLNPADLVSRGRAEVEHYGGVLRDGIVTDVTDIPDGVLVQLADGSEVTARALVVATGMVDVLPEIPGLGGLWGKKLLHCPYCHGWEVRNQRLAVVATSPFSLHQVELVRQWSDQLIFFSSAVEPLDDTFAQRLQARGTRIIDSPVQRVDDTNDGLLLTTGDGNSFEADAVFTFGTPDPNDAFLDRLQLAREDGPFGEVIKVDPFGRTSHPRVWAVGNVVNPGATVPVAMAAGSMAGGLANMALVVEDTDRAVAAHDAHHEVAPPTSTGHNPDSPAMSPRDFWEARYADKQQWSGNPNETMTAVVSDLTPGVALDLGCGEGADAIWLANNGWKVTGIDISEAAISRAREHGQAAGAQASNVEWVAADLSTWEPSSPVDLIVASFFQSPVALDRARILQRLSTCVSPGGHVLVIAHAAAPPWATSLAHAHHQFRTPDEELEQLNLTSDWQLVRSEIRTRQVTRDGQLMTLDDSVLLVQRT